MDVYGVKNVLAIANNPIVNGIPERVQLVLGQQLRTTEFDANFEGDLKQVVEQL